MSCFLYVYMFGGNQMRIAIDGPAGAGKSTVAKRVAHDLGYLYIDTGAMYRALTYLAIKNHINIHNESDLVQLLEENTITFHIEDDLQQVKVNGQDVTDAIRTPEISKAVSTVAAHEKVRTAMVKAQRALVNKGNVVMDGRDIGTYVLPEAEVKIFLSASIEERAKRRYTELVGKGYNGTIIQIREDIAKRDQLDSGRKFAPLRQAEDAIFMDTSNLTINEVIGEILQLVKDHQEGEGK